MLRIKQIAATLAVLALAMVGQAAAAGAKHARHVKHAGQSTPAVTPPATQTPTPSTTTGGAQPTSKRKRKKHHFHLGLRAHAASDPSDTISDYKFTPGSLTIHVGDTVTWTNVGPTAHTATALGIFDTGILPKGQSASHTFTQAGTIHYICTLHPYMKGTIVVLAAKSSGGSGPGNSGGSNPSSGTNPPASTSSTKSNASTNTSTTSTSNGLPNTGLNLVLTMLVAVGLIGLGATLRRGRRSSP